MIQATNLRIGNHVLKDGKIMQCKIILSGMTSYEPIPLTEEWLIKFGFQATDDYLISLPNGLFMMVSWPDYSVRVGSDECHYICDLKYVHSLQNLYFALTSEELTLTQTVTP